MNCWDRWLYLKLKFPFCFCGISLKLVHIIFTGLLSDKGLWEFANMIGAEWPHLATLLRIPKAKQDQIALDYPNNTMMQINEMLRLWRDSAKGSKEEIKGRLHEAFKKVKRADLAEYLLQETIHGSEERVIYNTIIWIEIHLTGSGNGQ